MDTSQNAVIDSVTRKFQLDKESGFNYQERRHEEWRENYTLYRDRVTVNRLTQRQSVNVPLMKTQIRTLLKDVDDMPVLVFENLDNDKQSEIFQNEYWKWTVEKNRMELKDIQDKKQDFFFGRTFDQMQIIDGYINFTIIDPEDIYVDRYMDPSNLDSSRFLIHTHIFVPLSYLEKNPDYDQEQVKALKEWYATDEGLIKAEDNKNSLEEKNQRGADLGIQDIDSPVLGETIVELSLHFAYDTKKNEINEQLFLGVYANDIFKLMRKPLEAIIGVTKDNYWQNHFPYNSWADDIDKQDFWVDGVADILRVPNKILNIWASQDIENRTLMNMGMQYYDSSMEGFNPQTWEPRAFGTYGIPVPTGKTLRDVFEKVDIPELPNSMEQMKFYIELSEKATGGTPTQQGAQTERQVTLGEVQLALTEAKERVKGIAKFYTQVWKDRAEKFLKFIEAAPDKLDAVKVYKKGRNSNNIYGREIAPKDWMTSSGYQVKIWSQEDKESRDTNTLQKLSFARDIMPDNPKLDEVFKRKTIEFGGLKPDEITEIMAYEEQKMQTMLASGIPINQPQLAVKKPAASVVA